MPIITHARAIGTTPVVSTCPSWCALPPGHAPEAVDSDGSTYRWHRAELPGGRVALEQTEVHGPDGAMERTPTQVVLDGRDDAPIPLADARRLAAALGFAIELGSSR